MHTVICAFDDRADAERAMDGLAERGFSRETMHLQVGYEAVATGSTAGPPPASATAGAAASSTPTAPPPGLPVPDVSGLASESAASGLLQRIAGFFGELFGRGETVADAGFYAEVLRRGGTILVVDAIGEQEATRARTLMDGMGGTVDIDERVAQWRGGGGTGPDAPAFEEPPAGPEPPQRAASTAPDDARVTRP